MLAAGTLPENHGRTAARYQPGHEVDIFSPRRPPRVVTQLDSSAQRLL